jgi:hypothetical protein
VPPGHEEQSLAYLDREVSALYQRGDEFGDNPALANAIDHYRALLKRRTRERVPLQWATTQNNLGNDMRGRLRASNGPAFVNALSSAPQAGRLRVC